MYLCFYGFIFLLFAIKTATNLSKVTGNYYQNHDKYTEVLQNHDNTLNINIEANTSILLSKQRENIRDSFLQAGKDCPGPVSRKIIEYYNNICIILININSRAVSQIKTWNEWKIAKNFVAKNSV